MSNVALGNSPCQEKSCPLIWTVILFVPQEIGGCSLPKTEESQTEAV